MKLPTISEAVEAILSTKNWTGLSLAELASAGRVVPSPSLDDWTHNYIGDKVAENEGNPYPRISLAACRELLDFSESVRKRVAERVTELNAN